MELGEDNKRSVVAPVVPLPNASTASLLLSHWQWSLPKPKAVRSLQRCSPGFLSPRPATALLLAEDVTKGDSSAAAAGQKRRGKDWREIKLYFSGECVCGPTGGGRGADGFLLSQVELVARLGQAQTWNQRASQVCVL